MAAVRYIVDDVEAAMTFYCEHLGFKTVYHPAETFAEVVRDDLHLFLSAPRGLGAGSQPMPDGRQLTSGGWNRISLELPDLEGTVDALRANGVPFRSEELITGVGGTLIILDDPSGNPVELFRHNQQ
ncbi:MAG TPA: VOC family protein [Micromonosporaceae bacterium]|jgi:catechol 2,3-dioxygenase-like lactoylglutathione lyase family enzyme